MKLSHLFFATAGIVSAGLASLFAQPATAANVELKADLGHSVISTKAGSHAYMRLSLKTLAAQERNSRPPINVAIVIDKSGSMSGARIDAAKDAAHVALDRLGSDDIVSLVSYNHRVQVLAPAARLGAARDEIERAIDRLRVDGTTALYAGTKEGGKQVETFLSDTNVNRVVLISDGLANVGPSKPYQLAKLGQQLASKGISVTTIGLGLNYNEDLMQRLAASSDGNHAFVESPRQLAGIFDKEFGDALSIAAQDVEIIIECEAGFKPTRVLGREAEITGSTIKLRLNQLQADNERYVVVEMETPDKAANSDVQVASVSVNYLDMTSGSRAAKKAEVTARLSENEDDVKASINKPVMAQVTTQIATERSEEAVSLRDKGDITGARQLLKDNAAYIKKSREVYSDGAGAVSSASAQALTELEEQNVEAAENLDEERWNRTRKALRHNQHKSKVQQAY